MSGWTGNKEEYFSHSPAETFDLGQKLGDNLKANTVICFFGDLAAGKTTLIKGLIAKVANITPDSIQSPTFTYLHIYDGEKTVYHFDLYRLRDIDEFLSMGFDEYFDRGGICCIEWSERIASYLPRQCIQIKLEHLGEDNRKITIQS